MGKRKSRACINAYIDDRGEVDGQIWGFSDDVEELYALITENLVQELGAREVLHIIRKAVDSAQEQEVKDGVQVCTFFKRL